MRLVAVIKPMIASKGNMPKFHVNLTVGVIGVVNKGGLTSYTTSAATRAITTAILCFRGKVSREFIRGSEVMILMGEMGFVCEKITVDLGNAQRTNTGSQGGDNRIKI